MQQVARNITTDGPFAPGDGREFFDKHPAALTHFLFHQHQDKMKEGRRAQLNEDSRELREAIDQSKVEEGRLEHEYQESRTTPFKTDEKGKRVPVAWQATYQTIRARANAGIAANDATRKTIGPNAGDDLPAFCANTRQPWRSLEMQIIAGDRPPLPVVKGAEAELKAVENEQTEVQNANRTSAEVEAILLADYRRRKIAGQPNFGNVLAGGSFRGNGEFTPANPGARPQLAKTAAIVHGDPAVFVEVDDLNHSIWADDEEKILAKWICAAHAMNAGTRQISEGDKIKMLREIAVRKLVAQRQLEAAYRHAEAQGIQVKRRPQPPHVLLWLEWDTAASKSKSAPVADTHDFEGEE